jgi:hypothetical protein
LTVQEHQNCDRCGRKLLWPRGLVVIEEAFSTTRDASLERLFARLDGGRKRWRIRLDLRLKQVAMNGLDACGYFVDEIADGIFAMHVYGLRLLFYRTPASAPCTGIRVTNGYIGSERTVRKHLERAIRVRKEDQER